MEERVGVRRSNCSLLISPLPSPLPAWAGRGSRSTAKIRLHRTCEPADGVTLARKRVRQEFPDARAAACEDEVHGEKRKAESGKRKRGRTGKILTQRRKDAEAGKAESGNRQEGICGQSQRDCILQPRVARHELPWVSRKKSNQPQRGCGGFPPAEVATPLGTPAKTARSAV